MSKATIPDILDEGFRPEQFGLDARATTGWLDSGGYIDRILQAASRWVEDKVGSTDYADTAAGTYAHDCMARAEVCYCRSTLFKRRVAFLDSSASIGAEARQGQYIDRREMLAHADAAWQCAEDALAEALRAIGADVTAVMPGGASFGHIETGIFPPVTTDALNV